jgi:DNA-binding response OmpR family regulator
MSQEGKDLEGVEGEEDIDISEAIKNATSEYGEPLEREKPLILIADDDAEMRKILRTYFQDMDCTLLESSDGAETLEQIIVHRPNLVVLDVMMPELNGWEVCKYVRAREEFETVGIIMLTAIGPTNNELTSPLFGADDYIDKPFDFEELEFKVRKVLSDRMEDAQEG